ncbi:hypothetical protein BJ170DRAFT_593664 [Xylariales sp. AK1849]|nr:hypothetical protein BJ170DRAFT_593664 [Xylariales sp. AK1849]
MSSWHRSSSAIDLTLVSKGAMADNRGHNTVGFISYRTGQIKSKTSMGLTGAQARAKYYGPSFVDRHYSITRKATRQINLVYPSVANLPGSSLVLDSTGETVAITFDNETIDTSLIRYQVGGVDWQFTNFMASCTNLLVSPDTASVNLAYPINPLKLGLRVTNWTYGVRIDQVHVASGESLLKIPNYGRSIEFTGGSLSAGTYTSYEGVQFSNFPYIYRKREVLLRLLRASRRGRDTERLEN